MLTNPSRKTSLDAGLVNGSGAPAMNGPWRVVVLGETFISSEGMAAILRRHSRSNVCAVVHEQKCAEKMMELHDPDLLLLEPSLESAHPIQWIKGMTARFPRTRILVVARSSERLHAERALRAGASAWFMKDGTIDELFRAIEAAISGEPHLRRRKASPRPTRKLVSQGDRSNPDLSALSDRELHVFSLVAAGHGIGRIAGELEISRKTVETHCDHIKLKLNYRDAEAMRCGARAFSGRDDSPESEILPDMQMIPANSIFRSQPNLSKRTPS